jgi:hypothetical protein
MRHHPCVTKLGHWCCLGPSNKDGVGSGGNVPNDRQMRASIQSPDRRSSAWPWRLACEVRGSSWRDTLEPGAARCRRGKMRRHLVPEVSDVISALGGGHARTARGKWLAPETSHRPSRFRVTAASCNLCQRKTLTHCSRRTRMRRNSGQGKGPAVRFMRELHKGQPLIFRRFIQPIALEVELRGCPAVPDRSPHPW